MKRLKTHFADVDGNISDQSVIRPFNGRAALGLSKEKPTTRGQVRFGSVWAGDSVSAKGEQHLIPTLMCPC